MKFTLSSFFRPPRKIAFTKEGIIFTLFTFPVGLAAINTGNNMLYLVLGMLLSIIAVSGFASESSVKKVEIACRIPRWIFAGEELISFAEVFNRKRALPSYLLRVSHLWAEPDPSIQHQEGFCVKLEAGESAVLRVHSVLGRRGVYHLKGFKLATRFPFGLFDKVREIEEPQSVVVYPQPIVSELLEQGRSLGLGETEQNVRGWGGDLYSLREYQQSDDARHIHWKTSAKVGRPMIQEYTSGSGRERTMIFLNTDFASEALFHEEGFERAISTVSHLLIQALDSDVEIGLWTPQHTFAPAHGDSHFHAVMAFLAALRPRFGVQSNWSEDGALHDYPDAQVFVFDAGRSRAVVTGDRP